ncbi:unnamed protein product [Nippostrongylus brasiliensis]|uniref:Uncharacterized protein n=1 Tax=Nippostrongylus brasiliensis TaxID=27835 RepID=A0A0N4Y8T7_NIPBR|nr:unnamed protein product [Nippostrongylus brasiliensis]
MSKQPSDEPKTIAEAKAEITEVLTKIKEHYDAILQMRLQDRNKWKEFNKIVEELEVVPEIRPFDPKSITGLRQPVRRLREIRPSYPEGLLGQHRLVRPPREIRRYLGKGLSQGLVLTGQTPQAMPLADLEKTQDMGQSDLKFDEKAGRDQRSATSKARPDDDEMVIHMDLPDTPEKERTTESRTPRSSQFRDGFYKAKVVNVPIVVYESESQSERSSPKKNNDNEKPDGLKKPRKKPSDSLLISYDMADEKYRYR